MWQQAALPRPPLQVSHGHPGVTHWQGVGDGSKKETPKVDPPDTLTYTQTHSHKQTLIPGFFAINPNAGDDDKKGGEVEEGGGDAVEMQKSGTGNRDKSDLKLKHTLLSLLYLINQTFGTILSALYFDRGQMNNRVCKYGKRSPYFLAQSGRL